MIDLPCWAGLDLSKTRDMSAIVLVFRDGDEFYQLPYFWMPENEARRQSKKAAFLQWHHDGELYFCNEDTIAQDDIYQKFEELAGRFDIRDIVYDDTYADVITAKIEENLNIERTKFSQGWRSFSGPTADYERLVIEGNLHHNGNLVLAWQAGHVHIRADYNNNKRPVKPGSDDHRKIDGIVAGIMALREAMLGDDVSTFKVGDSIFL